MSDIQSADQAPQAHALFRLLAVYTMLCALILCVATLLLLALAGTL